MKHEVLRQRFFEGAPRYRWLETLGRGAMGVVFKAQDLELDDVVAIKVLSPDIERDDQQLLTRFKREISLNRKIKHPNVARMFDFGMSGDYPYITMEFIAGKDLWTIIDEKGRLPAAEAVAILRQIARGADAIHKLGIVHRDLKSENVVVDEDGAAAILDFGLARGAASARVTLNAAMLGTPHYMSPEQAMGREVDARSDVYSIGIIAFEALTGRLPFTAVSPVAVAMKHVTEPLPDDLSRLPGVSRELRAAVLRALDKEPAKRFQTAADLETELAMLQTALAPVPPKPAPSPATDSERLSAEVESALDSILSGGARRHASRSQVSRPPPSAAPGKEPEAEPRVPVVLVVNDDVRALLRMATAVCQAGCRTVEVRNGQEALETVREKRVDLVLMDVALPDMDGFDVARILKSQGAFASLPVVLTTVRPDRAQMAFAIQSGVVDLLAKPVAPALLGDRLWRVLERRGFTPPVAREAGQRHPTERITRTRTRSRR